MQDWAEKDFYAVLGVHADADQAAIKKAYRKLARKLHPDANPGDANSERQFKEIGEAYAVLSDAEQRQQYDAVRAMVHGGARFTAGGPGGAGAGGATGFEDLLGGLFGHGAPAGGARVRYTTSGSPGGAGFEDLLGGLFGGPAGRGGPTGFDGFGAPRGAQPGVDLSATARLSFRDALDGVTVKLRIDPGHGPARTVTARIPAGVRDGQKVRLRGQGLAGDAGAPPGDLLVAVEVEPHPVFRRDGDNLRLTLPVTFTEAALGAEVDVPTPDGRTVRLRVPAGTPSGRSLRVRGRGVKRAGTTGDLLVTVEVVVPRRLNADARAAVEAFRKATADEDPRAGLLERARA